MLGSVTFRNLLFGGYTTYHDNGGVTTTYPSLSGDHLVSYHDNGGVTTTYTSLSGDHLVSYHSGGYSGGCNGGMDIDPGLAALSGVFYQAFAGGAIAFSFLSLIQLGKSAILAILLMLISAIGRVVMNYKCRTTFFVLWFHPFELLGWRLLVNAMWAHTNHNWLEPFGIFFLTLALGASYFIDCSESEGMFIYAWLSFFIMFFGRAYGSAIPFIICGILLVIAVIGTVIYSKMDPKDRHCAL